MRLAVDAMNGLGFALALVLSVAAGSVSTGRGLPRPELRPTLGPSVSPETLSDGTRVLRDASGAAVPLQRYERIASGTLVADRVLSDLCEPTRIVSFTRYAATQSVFAHRLAGKASLDSRAPIETVLALRPDLFVVNNLVDPGYVAQLREHGLRVFDLGHMLGLSTLIPNIHALGYLIGAPERAADYARSLERRMHEVAATRRGMERPRALYLAVYGDRLYGGAGGTSYHDVIEYAGLRDAGAVAGLTGWPELSSERVLAIDPEVVVTKTNMGAVLCRHAGLTSLRPCTGRGRLIELDGALLDDPGPAILEATEMLYDAYWGAQQP